MIDLINDITKFLAKYPDLWQIVIVVGVVWCCLCFDRVVRYVKSIKAILEQVVTIPQCEKFHAELQADYDKALMDQASSFRQNFIGVRECQAMMHGVVRKTNSETHSEPREHGGGWEI